MSHLALRDISFAFGDAPAIHKLSFEVEPGEFLSLLGPSGCGKTTTLRLIAGFIDPTEGCLEVSGRVIAGEGIKSVPPEDREMALIFQSYAVWPHMTVGQNVAYGLKIRRLQEHEIRKRVAEALERVGIGSLGERYPHTLSGGQQQRVSLARALVIEPAILLLDEPLSNLDASLRAEMRLEIQRIHEELHMTCIYVTHDQLEALSLSDRIAVMNHGKIEQIDKPLSIYSAPASPFVAKFLGRWNCLPCTVTDTGSAVLDNSTGVTVRIADRIPRGSATLGLSMDDIDMTSESPNGKADATCFATGTITGTSYMGRCMEYIVSIDNSALQLRVEGSTKVVYALGDRVSLGISPQAVHVFDRTQQQ